MGNKINIISMSSTKIKDKHEGSVKSTKDDHYTHAPSTKDVHDKSTKSDHHEHEDVARKPFPEWLEKNKDVYMRFLMIFAGVSFLLAVCTSLVIWWREDTTCSTGKIKISLWMCLFFSLMNLVVCLLLMTPYGRNQA